MVSEWFPSGFRVVSECGFGVRRLVRGFFPSFWALKAVRRVVRGFIPGFWAPRSCPEGLSEGLWLLGPQRFVRGFVRGFVPGFCALKAVRRVVRGFVRGVVRGFKPVWTQNMKIGVYAEPPLSRYVLPYKLLSVVYNLPSPKPP